MDIQQLYRGLLRGFTSDVVGGPADIAEQLANLGIAGYGYAGHKLGLLDASQLPKLLEASPGTSEWFARLAKNPDSGSPEYTAGRFVPAAVGLARAGAPIAKQGLVKALENAAKPGERGLARGQRGAIRVGGAPDLYIGHSGSISESGWPRLGNRGPAVYGNSFGVTAGQVPNFQMNLDEYGGLLLVPRLGALDPATYPTRLWNRDAYTLRSKLHPGRSDLEYGSNLSNVAPRLLEAKGLVRGDLEFTEGGLSIPPWQASNAPSHKAALLNSPRFGSFAEFEASPAGAATLRSLGVSDPRADSSRLFFQYRDEAQKLFLDRFPNDFDQLDQADALIEKLLYYPSGKRRDALQKIRAKDPEFAQSLSGLAKAYRDRFAQLPSEYGELQNYGLLPITPETFAGAFVIDSGSGKYTKAAEKSLGGIPIISRGPGNVSTADLDNLLAEAGPARTARKGLIRSYVQKPGGLNAPARMTSVAGWSGLLPKAQVPAVTAYSQLTESQILNNIKDIKSMMADDIASGMSQPTPALLQDLVNFEDALKVVTSKAGISELESKLGKNWWNSVSIDSLTAAGKNWTPDQQKAVLKKLDMELPSSEWKTLALKEIPQNWATKTVPADNPWGLLTKPETKPQSTTAPHGFFTKVAMAKANPHDVNSYKNAFINPEFDLDDELNTLLVVHKNASWAPETLASLIDAALATKQFFPANLAKKYPEFAQQWPELFLPE